MYSTLRKYIRATLRSLFEDKQISLLLEPDQSDKESKEENTLAGGGIRGITGPIGDTPVHLKKKSDVGSRSFGGAEYEKEKK